MGRSDFFPAEEIDTFLLLEDTPYLFVRDITQSGYNGLVKNPNGEDLSSASVEEWSPLPATRLFGDASEAMTLRLPILESPEIPWEENLGKWQKVEYGETGDVSDNLQKAINAAASSGKTTVYLPHTTDDRSYTISSPVRVHGSVNRIAQAGYDRGGRGPLLVSLTSRAFIFFGATGSLYIQLPS